MEMSKDEDPQDDILPESNKITQLLTETQKSQTMATPRTATVESRSYSFEKELLESQMHKMQLENSTLKTENKLLKDKYNRATARISELESHLSSMREELGGLQDNLDTEVIRAGRQARAEADRELQHSQSKMAALMHENEKHQAEIRNLQQKLESAVKEAELLKRSIDSSKAIEAHKQETGMMKTEIAKLRELLAASEKQLDEECHKRMELSQQVSKLTEMRELFQLQMDTAGYIGSAAEKKITALEQRLHVTEERLTQERADRASNLSQVEEKLLSDNAKLQALEKELRRQLQREKDKNRNLEHRAHEYREENLKLRLAVPDDDENIASYKSYDIPNNAHSSSRQQTKRVEDIKYILKELEKEGVEGGEAAALVALWNRTQQQRQEIKEWRVYLTDLTLPQDNTSEGLKMLREKLIEYEKQFREIEEKLGDIQAEKMTIDSTYKQQLLSLVKERHEASARLRTLEDLMDALRRENEVLRQGLASSAPTQGDPKMIVSSGAQLEAVVAENQALELRVSQLIRNSRSLEAEVDTLRAQVSARDIALEELSTELKTAHAQKSQTEDSAILKQKIEDLNVEMEQMQREMRTVAQQAEIAQKEKTHLQEELEEMDKQYQVAKARLTKHRAQREEDKDPKVAVLESELEEKDTQLLTLTSQLRQMEDKLETTQQQLTLQKDANSLLHMQVKELEAVLQQRGEMLETLAEKRSDLFEQLTLVKSHLNATTLALHQKQSQIQVLQKELAQEKDRATSLSDQIAQMQKTDLGKADLGLPESVLEVKLQERENEIAILKGKLQNIVQELASKQDECDVAYQETMKLNEEIVAAKALTCRFNSEEAFLRQELETGLQNYECQTQELRKCEEDLIKMEFRLQEVLCRFEAEACSQQALIIPQQTELTSDDIPKIYSELHNLRLLTEEKSKEINMLQDKISRQQLQLCNQEKHLQTLQSIQTHTKEDVRHLSEALSLKIKEYAVTANINCTLAKEHSSLQKENQRLLKEIDEETAYKEKHRAEISEIIKKVEKHETKHLEATQVVQQKDSLIAELEAEIRQVKRSLTQVEVENEQLKTKVDLLNEDIRNLGNVNTTLEKRLEIERTSLSEERANASKRREDMAAANQRLEDLKLEQNTLQGSLGAERRNAQKLKDEIENHKEEEKKLQKQINT
ncbi:cingulin-like protein 1 isoform X1 [Pomacea canaliculata]|uniref:cingulin-like protein 1 isoform X1 n=1 Tax=Pomacea canaliculata TaxID=400727 RepID=UPI000D73036A|nr:cingulin-like protein 1 isoform X1 [Pomacea canaliculata]XP_025077438.1 cingulin-like protein 1 isoform X1 [Pomacea canaliculata]XP_025077439.1 cingulin-like protein 1 isoform X1 [Pomacea canaliculata]XP_025077440.1 cingulin-like protein 1 isoform X1 [Pomacea canaliculata]